MERQSNAQQLEQKSEGGAVLSWGPVVNLTASKHLTIGAQTQWPSLLELARAAGKTATTFMYPSHAAKYKIISLTASTGESFYINVKELRIYLVFLSSIIAKMAHHAGGV